MADLGRVTWFSRIWSWNPSNLWDASVNEEVPGTTSAVTSIDFDDNVLNSAFRGMESVKRRNAVRTRVRKGRQRYRPSNDDSTSYNGWSTSLNETQTPVKTIFDWYHPWKVEPIEKAIAALPPTYHPVFYDAIRGNNEQLHQYLESLEFVIDTATVVNYVDDKGRSPIHFASAFGHLKVTELLLSYGANSNALDSTMSITPLVCAAVNGSEIVMELLISNGADINLGLEKANRTGPVGDSEPESNTALSWAVRAGSITSVKYLLRKGALLAGTTINYCTALHEAAYLGNTAVLKLLLQNERNLQSLELRGGKDKTTALHVAVEQGHLDCMELLLSVGAKPNKFNIHGQTPLQLAAMTKDSLAIQLLIKNGADTNTRDTRNRSPLHHCIHLASMTNYVEAIQCIEILLSNGADIDAQDENGFTPFHTAVDDSASSIVATLLKQGADLTLANNAGQSGVEILVKKMPHAIRYIRESLDFSIFVKKNDIADPDCVISFDFRPIIVTNTEEIKGSTSRKETEVLMSFCAFGHYDILSHPLVEAFLVLKWEKVKKYFWASFIANMLMVLTYSYFVFHLYSSKCPLTVHNFTLTYSQLVESEIIMPIYLPIYLPTYLHVIWYLLFIMIFVFTGKEFFQLVLSPKSYFKMGENYIQLLFIILALMTILPDPLGPINLKGDLCQCLDRWNHIHYKSAAVSVVVAWFLILLRIGKLPKLGLYVQMFFKVVGNFGIFVITYSSIIIAFTLSFGILLDDENDKTRTFSNIFHSFLSTVVMMTGELTEFSKVIEHTSHEKPLFVVTYVIFTAFVLLVTIVLMNLLVGLAVSDIQGLREGAKVARLSRLVIAISQLESMLFSNGLINILPKRFVKHLRRNALFANEYKTYNFSYRPHDPRDKKIPRGVQLEALQILEKRENDRIRTMKKTNKETDTKLELLERLDKVETLLQNLDKLFSDQLNKNGSE